MLNLDLLQNSYKVRLKVKKYFHKASSLVNHLNHNKACSHHHKRLDKAFVHKAHPKVKKYLHKTYFHHHKRS